ncbi:MAG: EFR1 family ferrodoxin [Clostridia bacterium]|nr:EFR1 family ferrodoxin [Clostridia bacterium]
MNAIIYVFSGTGNTMRIAKLYKAAFEKRGVITTLYPVHSDMSDLPDPEVYDYVGFAYPIHAFNAPEIMLSLAKSIKAVSGKEYFILKSSGEPLRLNNVSSLRFASILKKKGFILKSEYHYVMPYNMIFRHTDREALKMWETAKALAAIEAGEVLRGVEHKLPRVFLGRFIAWLLRIEQIAMRINGRFFKVKSDQCILCRKCEKACPAENIRIDENGKFSFGKNCIMCARCSFHCPTDAIKIGILNGWRVNGDYPLDRPLDESLPEPKHHHGWYCKRAYARYYAEAAAKITEYQNALSV